MPRCWLNPNNHLCTIAGTPQAKTIDQMLKPAMQAKKNSKETKARKLFKVMKQKKYEKAKQWLTRVKKVAVNCGFENELDTKIKDKFVSQIKTEAVKKIVSELPKEKSLDEVLAAAVKAQVEHKEDMEEDTSSSSSEDKSETDSDEEWSVDNDEAYRPVHAYDCPCQYCNIIRSNMWGPKGYIGLGKPKEKIVYLSKKVKDWK